jgi:hypothetical protein
VQHGRAAPLPSPSARPPSPQSAASLLVVAPDSLPALADGTLRLGRRAALEWVALRADYRAARVGGRPLAELFEAG